MRETNYEESRWLIFVCEEEWVLQGILEKSSSEKLELGNVFSVFSWERECFKLLSLPSADDVFA